MIDSYNLQEIMKIILKYTICCGSNVSEIYFSFILYIFIYYIPLQFLSLINLQDSSYKHECTSRVENTVDPDQLASKFRCTKDAG